MKANIGLIGLAVMGENLALNMESKGFTVAVYNRSVPGEEGVVDRFINGRGKSKRFIGTHSIEQLVDSVKSPGQSGASCRRADLAIAPFPFVWRCNCRRRQF